ncbi:FAD binding domain-containing protein [Ilyonectria destructans]|nr:FAD binding domain-containing protein [Ilyonectria destructans]
MRTAPNRLCRLHVWRPCSNPGRVSSGTFPFANTRPVRAFATVASKFDNDEETDILIVGSGAAALTAALRANAKGLQATIIEKRNTVGGASAISGGGLWIPMNSVSKAAGIQDSKEAALRYINQVVGDVGPASSFARRHAYLDNGPKMIDFLQEIGFQFRFSKGYPDYYPNTEGGMGVGGGRTIESKPFNLKKLGNWQKWLPTNKSPPIQTNDAGTITRMTSSTGAFLYTARKMIPLMMRAMTGQKLTSMGHGLVAQLLYLNKLQGTDIRLETAFVDLMNGPNGTITGVRVNTKDEIRTIRAKRGVVLAAGGFAHNREMREKYLPSPSNTQWTMTPDGDTGDAVLAGVNVGAATALMDDAWWTPTIFDPVTGRCFFTLTKRARPYCIIVDASGQRFMNEAQSYTAAGQDQYERNRKVNAIPAWMVMDCNHRNRYMLGTLFARADAKKAIAAGRLFRADTIEGLADQIQVDPQGLAETIQKYNGMCKTGIDSDFGKGNNAYDNYFGDPVVGPNPNMGPLEKSPFYAIQLWPGDIGTKGGLLTDEFQRVLREDGTVIKGLYAIGNTSASIMGRMYPGAGATLGPAMTHGFVSVDDIASRT